MTRLAVLVSGRGSNMRAILDATRDGSLDAEVVVVVSDRADAPALDIARSHGVPTDVIDARTLRTGDVEADRARFDRRLIDVLGRYRPDLVALAGFMRILGETVVDAYAGRMVNIHPSLLPAYPGLDTHRRAIAAGDREHGASVHYVTAELDGGPVIAQARVPILDDDTPERLASRVLEREHELYVEALVTLVTDRTSTDSSNADTHPGPTSRAGVHDSTGDSRERACMSPRDQETDGAP